MEYLFVGGMAFVMAIVAMAVRCFYFPGRITLDILPESDNIIIKDQEQNDGKGQNTRH